jgi:hypothetical protein
VPSNMFCEMVRLTDEVMHARVLTHVTLGLEPVEGLLRAHSAVARSGVRAAVGRVSAATARHLRLHDGGRLGRTSDLAAEGCHVVLCDKGWARPL